MNSNLHPVMVMALAPFAPPPAKRLIPMDCLNQDDWYVFVEDTGELLYTTSSKYAKPVLKEGQAVMRGMTVQHREIQLWSKS